MVRALFDREQEDIWDVPLIRAGYENPRPSPMHLDLEEATDRIAGDRWFALRSRNMERYSPIWLDRYMGEFTIRYSRPTGARTEWAKLFDAEIPAAPDLMAYGWADADRRIRHYFILSVPALQRVESSGVLYKAVTGPIKNRDARRSSFMAVSVRRLARLLDKDEFGALFAYVSPGHPAF